MNYALIFAGGSGVRMNAKSKPKQFLELGGKAIIIHTLEYFEYHAEIDAICVVCLADWIGQLSELLRKNHFQKVKWIVPGAETGQLSIFAGVTELYQNSTAPDKDVVLIHDGVRPLITAQLISDNIESVKRRGSGITVHPVAETVVLSEGGEIRQIYDRSRCKLAKAPQSFWLADIMDAHQRAAQEGLIDIIDSASLMKLYGYSLHEVDGPPENIKITTPADFYIFRAIYEARENSQIWGL